MLVIGYLHNWPVRQNLLQVDVKITCYALNQFYCSVQVVSILIVAGSIGPNTAEGGEDVLYRCLHLL